MSLTEVIGNRYGRLVIIKEAEKRGKNRRVLCHCDCGVEREMALNNLQSGNTQSCGCHRVEVTTERSIKHRMTNTRLYIIWKSMRHRCIKTDNLVYGGRGIKVCKEWQNDFVPFMKWAFNNGYQDDLSIDRIDSDGNYCPENCRWATRQDQNANRGINCRNTSGFTGVGWNKISKKWLSRIDFNHKQYRLGLFDTPEIATSARNYFIIQNNLPHELQF